MDSKYLNLVYLVFLERWSVQLNKVNAITGYNWFMELWKIFLVIHI